MKYVIIVSLVFLVLFFVYRACTKGYKKFGYFGHAKNEAVFQNNKQTGNKQMSSTTLEQDKINEYLQYDPSKAAKDVEQDIRNHAIKLFYADLYEVPEILSIAADPHHLPPHTKIYIGTGCTDSYHSDDCSKAYGDAMDRALSYGRAYNIAMASHLKVELKTQYRDDLNATQKFIDQPAQGRPGVKIELSDIQPIFGGRHILIDGGSGQVVVQTVRPQKQGLERRIYADSIDKDEMDKILEVFVQHDFVTLHDSEKTGPPDQGRPKITLENAKGVVHSVWNWDPPIQVGDTTMDERFHAIYRTLLKMETRAVETLEPISTDPYTE